jgi:hypothetical protein
MAPKSGSRFSQKTMRRGRARCQQAIAGRIRRAGLNDRAAPSVKGVNNPRAVNAGRRHPADGARIRAFPREAAGRRVYNDVLPGFYSVGVELRHLRFQRGNSVLHTRPIAWTPQLRLCAQTRQQNCGCARENNCKNAHRSLPCCSQPPTIIRQAKGERKRTSAGVFFDAKEKQ